jgi:hypothetical protein
VTENHHHEIEMTARPNVLVEDHGHRRIPMAESTGVYAIDPLRDPRWAQFVESHPMATVFHTPAWLNVLKQTYGYEPVVLTTSSSGHPLKNGLVSCRVSSFLTGSRYVSLPFTDHCQPLVDNGKTNELSAILLFLRQDLGARKWNYGEIRPLVALPPEIISETNITPGKSFGIHRLDLSPPVDQLLKNCHKTAIQQPLRRAERERIKVEEGRSDFLLGHFYKLLLMTRRRHGLPPQPIAWFENVIGFLKGQALVRVAFKDQNPIASILTLSDGKTLVYKYGCSDPRFSNLGGTVLLLWRAIESAKKDGLLGLDFGRSDLDNIGLIAFKDRWGSTRNPLQYYRYSSAQPRESGAKKFCGELAQRAFPYLPDYCLRLAGRLLYRHIG